MPPCSFSFSIYSIFCPLIFSRSRLASSNLLATEASDSFTALFSVFVELVACSSRFFVAVVAVVAIVTDVADVPIFSPASFLMSS
jgi:hypothetical protein